MTHPAPVWLRYAAVAVAFTTVGILIGIVVAPQPQPWMCSIEQGTHLRPCPPDTDREVWATWSGGLTTKARYRRGTWHFSGRILGQTTTTDQPQSWSETP